MTREGVGSAAILPALDLEQTHVQAFLDASLRGRVPSLLFVGPPGSGKEYVAIDFARRLCCEREPACLPAGDGCESCRKAARLEHPGIQLTYPTPTQGSGEKEGDDEPDIGKVLEEKRRDIFGHYRFTKKASIRIARAREIIMRANTKPFGGGFNVFIIVDAQAMREEAQNALLKLVEEPPDRSVLVWITPNPDAILYTIRSRCQRVRFSPLKAHVIETILKSYYGIPADISRKAAGLSQGNIRRARDIAEHFDDKERRSAYEFVAGVLTAPNSWIFEKAAAVSRGSNRDAVAVFLHELALAYRDIMAGDDSILINPDQRKMFAVQRANWNPNRLPRVVDRIVTTRDDILRRNANIDAALVDLFLDIKQLGC